MLRRLPRRLLPTAGTLVLAAAVLALAPAGVAAQARHRGPPTATPTCRASGTLDRDAMERPDDLAEQSTLTAEETAAWEQRLAERREANESEREDAPLGARLGYSVRIWFEHGHTLTDQRTSLWSTRRTAAYPALPGGGAGEARRVLATGTPTAPRTAASRNAASSGSTRAGR